MRRWLRRRAVAGLLVVGLAGALLAQGQSVLTTRSTAPLEHVRGAEQTLLTYPEWFLVFSPAEYAEFTAGHAPSDFPWYGHVGQFWESYAAVTAETQRRDMDLNPGYHMMLMVIGISTTLEYALRSGYEMLVGRLTEALSSAPTAEDRHAVKVAREYVDFIRVRPWHQFDFGQRLRELWTQTGWWGPDALRKWERKLALSTEYGIKLLYGRLIRLATQSVYEAPLDVTVVVTRAAPLPDPKLPEMKVLQVLPDGQALVCVPRYAAFTTYAQAMAARGVYFEEIAGNRNIILVSLLAPRGWNAPLETPTLFAQPILTQADRQRVALLVPVRNLTYQLRLWQAAGLQVEHIFDY